MKSAARIAKTFGIDPVAVLNAEPFEWMVRVAAHNVVVADENRQNAAAKKKG